MLPSDQQALYIFQMNYSEKYVYLKPNSERETGTKQAVEKRKILI